MCTLGLQCAHREPVAMGALQLRHASFFFANFMMPPDAVDGVVTAIDRVCAPEQIQACLSTACAFLTNQGLGLHTTRRVEQVHNTADHRTFSIYACTRGC